MGLIYVRLHLCELLDRPFRDIDQSLYLVTSCCIKPGNRALQLAFKLAIVAQHKVEDVEHLSQSLDDEILLSTIKVWKGNELACKSMAISLHKMALLELKTIMKKLHDCKTRLEEPKAAVSDEEINQFEDLELHLVFIVVQILAAIGCSSWLFVQILIKDLPFDCVN